MVHTVDASSAEAAVSRFWAGIRGGDLNAIVEETRTELRAFCPSIDTFSFDIVDDPQEAATLRELPTTSVEAGTPRPVVASWNDDKLVGVFVFSADNFCGAAVGTDVSATARDFKVCCLPTTGEDKCMAGTHVGPRTKRILPPVGDFMLTIAVPISAGAPKQVFSRPILDAQEFRFVYDTPDWSRLMSIKMEPRVWKLLFENFPGAYIFSDSSQAFFQQPPQVRSTAPSQPMSEPVTADPILSPRGGREASAQSFQRTGRDEGWNFDDDNMSRTSRTAAAAASSKTTGQDWANYFQRPDSPADSRGSGSRSANPSDANQDWWKKKAQELQARVKQVEEEAEALRLYLDIAFKAAGRENRALRDRLDEAEESLRRLRGQQGYSSGGTLPMATTDFDELVGRMKTVLAASFCTVEQFNTLSAAGASADLTRRVGICEGELFNSAGSVPRLDDRVKTLEAARSVSAIEVGGFVFVDEAATEAWVRTHSDPDLHRFAPDFVSYFLLADPKFETVAGGLDRMAAVAKAQFSSLDVATIGLSFSIIYPPNMLKKTDKVEAQLTNGYVWAPPFGSCDAFEGEFNNGTHLRLKRELQVVGKAIDEGIEYYFPSATHPKTNAVFKTHARMSLAQCLEFLDSLIPLYKQISGGGMSGKEAWSRVMVYAKQVFDDVRTVRAPNSAASTGSYVWAAFRTAHLLKEYQRHNWVEHPKTSSILALTSMRKEGKAIEELTSKVQGHTSSVSKLAGDVKKLQEEFKELKKKNPSLL